MSEIVEMKCPHCGMTPNINEIYMDEMRERFKERNTLTIQESIKNKEEELQNEAQKKIEDAVRIAKEGKEQEINQLLEQIKLLTEANKKQNEQMLEFQKQQFELEQKVLHSDAEAQKKINAMIEEIYQKARKEADEAKEIEIAKLNKKIVDANKVSEDLQKKLDQGSQQLYGEIQELKLEDCLREEFPFDDISEVEKGKYGADIIQTVINRTGKVCGKIIWESKNVKGWKNEFLSKLRNDVEREDGDIGILVSNVFGKNMVEFSCVDGVWLVKPQNVLSIGRVIRDRIEAVSNSRLLVERKETVQEAVYSFVTSTAFRNRIENIGRQYRALGADIDKTKDIIMKHWETQRKLIDELVGNTQGILGEVDAFLLQSDNGITELEQIEENTE